MVFSNPFSPIFGGRPRCFFGREDILARFGVAMLDDGSEDRALFVTGNRGCGKTALIEQLSRRAAEGGMRTIDLGPEHTVETLMRSLQRYDEVTSALNPSVGVSMFGSGVSLGGVSSSKTVHYSAGDLQTAFLDVSKSSDRGLFVSVDEVQKVPLQNMSEICGAFQMASRKGYDVMLVVAGLPYAFGEVTKYEGCTYMRRSRHEELSLLHRDEVVLGFEGAFGSIGGFELGEYALQRLVSASMGQPYMMQLLGYYLVAGINKDGHEAPYIVSGDDVNGACKLALAAFERRALQPIVEELSPAELDYLKAMAATATDDGSSGTGDVAAYLGREQRQLSTTRASLLRNGIVVPAGWGRLMFNVAYLRQYVLKEPGENMAAQLARDWGL